MHEPTELLRRLREIMKRAPVRRDPEVSRPIPRKLSLQRPRERRDERPRVHQDWPNPKVEYIACAVLQRLRKEPI